jgi:tellurite resistance protein TerC
VRSVEREREREMSSKYGANASDHQQQNQRDPSNASYSTSSSSEDVSAEKEKNHNNKKRDLWNVPGGPVDPGLFAKYNDWVRRKPLEAMVGSLLVIVLFGVFESVRDNWQILPYYGEAVMLETVLSLDNIVVFHQIFESLKVPNSRRPSILLLGVPIMIGVRLSLFLVLRGMLSKFWPAFIVIGLYLAYQGYQTMIEDDDDDDDDDNEDEGEADEQAQGVTAFVRRTCHSAGWVTKKYHGSALWVIGEDELIEEKNEGVISSTRKCMVTPAMVCLIVIELCDIIFCIDGVATIYELDHYRLRAAIMGDITAAVFVRTCYPVVGNAVNLFPDVKYSVGLTLIFVGVDMILDAFDIDLPAWALGTLMPLLFIIGIASSLIRGGGTSKDLSKILGDDCSDRVDNDDKEKGCEVK